MEGSLTGGAGIVVASTGEVAQKAELGHPERYRNEALNSFEEEGSGAPSVIPIGPSQLKS